MIDWIVHRKFSFIPLVLGASLCFGAACSQAPDQVDSPSTMPASFSASGDVIMLDRWWESFEDEGLNQAMNEALNQNFSLRASWDRMSLVTAVAKREGAPLWPSVNLNLGGERDHTKRNEITTNATSLIMGLAVSYEVDLWGRIRNAHRAAEFDMQVTEEDIHAAALSLTATLAEAWFNLAEARATLEILNAQVVNNEKQLELLNTRFRQGQSQAVDVLRQEQLLESTKGLRRESERRAAVLEHTILILMGRPPQEAFQYDVPRLLDLPPLPQTGLPSELIRKRPDLRAAELEIKAEDRRLASAIGSQFPRLSLTADLTKTGKNISDLMDNWMASIAASLAQPIFDAGRLAAEVERQKAVRSEAINLYGNLVLTAFKEVEDALISEKKQAEFLISLKRQLELSQQVIERSRTGYLNGQLDYLNVLNAMSSRQGLERQYVSARTDLILYRIALYRALAGGFEMTRPDLQELSEDGSIRSGDENNE